jgi:hypothetical protein
MQNNFVQDNFEVNNITTKKVWKSLQVYVQIKAQEWEDIVQILSVIESQMWEKFWDNFKVQFEIIRVFRL